MKLKPNFILPVDEEILLKLPKVEEAELLFALVDKNRAHLRTFLSWVDSTKSIADTQKFIEEDLARTFENEALLFAIWFQGNPIGLIGCHAFDHQNHTTIVGYWLDENHLGKGIMTRSLNALVDFVFKERNVHRVELRCAIHNLRSCKVAEGAGFTKEALLKEAICLHGKFIDAFLYARVVSD